VNRLAKLRKLRKRWILIAEYKLRKIQNSILIYKSKKNRALILIYVFYLIEDYRLIISLIQDRSSSRKRTVSQNFNDSVKKDIAEAEKSPNNNNKMIIRRVKQKNEK
jgi:hypothetical protein